MDEGTKTDGESEKAGNEGNEEKGGERNKERAGEIKWSKHILGMNVLKNIDEREEE